MTRRISCYVVFVTLIWSAHTQNEEKVPDNMFKSNMTRNDFSNLLQSLVKLNEQRVSVLKRLNKLEDYGVLSEVLRSGDNQPAENGNPNNLFLIVMSKGSVDARTIVKKYQVLRDDEENQLTEDKQPTENTDKMDNETITRRRNNEDSGNSASVESESKEDDSIEEEQRAHDKTNHSNHRSKTTSRKSKNKEEKKTKIRKALRERDEREEVKKEIKERCVNEIDNKKLKCIKACRRTQKDVCTRLACSDRSQKELRKECDKSCKETFVPESC